MPPRVFDHRIKRPPKLHELVAKQIQAMILSEGMEPGTKIVPERALCDQFDVSRTVIRESLKVLIARGVLKEVPGKGTFVWQNVTEPLKDLLNVFAARYGPDGHNNLFEARRLLEVEIAGLAAERATAEDLAHLRKLNDRLARMNRVEQDWTEGKVREYNEIELQFHLYLAKCTKNDFFVVLLNALSDAFSESWTDIHARPETRKQGVNLHSSILAAIAAKDARAARRATRENLKAFLEASPHACCGAPKSRKTDPLPPPAKKRAAS